MLSTVGAGGQTGDSDTTPAHFWAAISLLVRSLVAASLPLVRGLTSSHQLISSSSKLVSQFSNNFMVCHIGSMQQLLLGEACITWHGVEWPPSTCHSAAPSTGRTDGRLLPLYCPPHSHLMIWTAPLLWRGMRWLSVAH